MSAAASSPSSPPPLFSAPHSNAPRRLLASFSHLQRIGKGANTAPWFSESLRGERKPPAIEWAAVRQFELLQEAGNLAIEDLDVADMNRAFQSMQKMRGGGYRITQILLGDMNGQTGQDDLALFDRRLQEEIALMIHFLYLEEWSATLTSAARVSLAEVESGTVLEALPHIVRTRLARRLFKPAKETAAEEAFFALLSRLPARHILHETAVGLVLPDATKEKNWTYIAAPEFRFAAFQNALTNVLGGLDRTMASMRHMRGYGDRLGSRFENWGGVSAGIDPTRAVKERLRENFAARR